MLTITRGTIADLDRLAHLHHRPGRPATWSRVLVAHAAEGTGSPVGVLVVSMPTLNAPWRDLAWPGRFRSADKRADARRVKIGRAHV